MKKNKEQVEILAGYFGLEVRRTQQSVANYLGVSPRHLYNYMRGVTVLPLEARIKLHEIFEESNYNKRFKIWSE